MTHRAEWSHEAVVVVSNVDNVSKVDMQTQSTRQLNVFHCNGSTPVKQARERARERETFNAIDTAAMCAPPTRLWPG